MPFAQINIMEGRTDEQKRVLIRNVTQAISDSLDAPVENVRIMINEVPKTQWGIAGKTAQDLGR